MTRPPYAATLCFSAALAVVVLGAAPADAGQALWPPGQSGNGHFTHGVNGGSNAQVAPRPSYLPSSFGGVVRAGPQANGQSYTRSYGYRRYGGPQIYDVNASREDNYARLYRTIGTGDFRYGRFYDALLNGPYGGAGGGYVQPGPTIITLGAPAVAAPADPLVIQSQAPTLQHGVRVISLLDPPSEFQLQANAPPLPPVVERSRKKGHVAPITPKY